MTIFHWLALALVLVAIATYLRLLRRNKRRGVGKHGSDSPGNLVMRFRAHEGDGF